MTGAAVGGSVGLLLLLLGMCLYWRRKRSAKVIEQPSPIQEKMGIEQSSPIQEKLGRASPVYNPDVSTYLGQASTAPIVMSYLPTNPAESSSAMGQSLPSEQRMTVKATAPVTTSSQDTAIPFIITGYDATIPSATSGYDTNTPVITPGLDTTIHRPTENPPPMYEGEDVAQIQSEQARVQEAERARQYDMRMADFCATNRDLISPALERKLHNARYLPEDNPSDVSADYWRSAYGVEFFDLRRLQTAYDRFRVVWDVCERAN